MKTVLNSFALVLATIAPAIAQHHGHADHPGGAAAHSTPYAGMQDRAIKALSEAQIAGLRGGKGMAMAMPAELNGYPGPAHVLELAAPLQLTEAQIARTTQLHSEMLSQARAAGEEVIAAEAELDGLFRAKTADGANLSSAVAKAALAQGRLRETHLRYHLTMMDVLTPAQIAAYNQRRGY